ncbi:efflux transporter periplasmic adaptor subunit [bacterium]|nr:MAG: efflux transporter periplasmic adaptor subunit [bacterium]
MKTNSTKSLSILRSVWSYSSGIVAVLLILASAFLGYQYGSSNTDTKSKDLHSLHENESEQTTTQLYTCSMHPTIRLEDKDAKCPICFMSLIPVSDSNQGLIDTQLVLSESAIAMSKVQTTKVAQFYPTASIRLYGKLTYDETAVARISAYFPGRIERLFTNYVGVPVQKGEHIAEVYSPELLAAFEELRQAKAAFNQLDKASDYLRKTTIQMLEASRDKLHLLGIADDQIQQVEAGNHDSNALTIYSPISGVVTKLETREGDYINTGDPIATVADLSRLWLDMQVYESQLPYLRWGLPVTFTTESSPGQTFTGNISYIDPVVNEKTRTITLRVAVDNSDHNLKPGMFVSAVVYAKLTDRGVMQPKDLAGKWVSPMHPTIVKDEPGNCDICGMDLVQAEQLGIVASNSDNDQVPLVIPRSAVLFTGTRSVVYVQVNGTDQPTYEGRNIILGAQAGDFYIVREGLTINDRVVSNGAFRVDSAMQILAKPSMMNQENESFSTNPLHHQHGQARLDQPQRDELPNHFVHALDSIFDVYLKAQIYLANDDFAGYIQAVSNLKEAVKDTNLDGLQEQSLGLWQQISLGLIPGNSILTIEDARINFDQISKAVIHLQEEFGHRLQNDLHIAFCPMAFDFEGAKWLQQGTEINNPYFGESMLRCGEIKQTLQPVQGGNE